MFTMETEQNKTLSFTYEMQMDYSSFVGKAFFTIKAIPHNTHRQSITSLTYKIKPEAKCSEGTDSFGNNYIYGNILSPHGSFSFSVYGKVEITDTLFEEEAEENLIPLYRHPYGLNKSGEKLSEYFESLKPELEENDYVNAVYLMHRLNKDFSYRKGVTDSKTSAEEAWSKGSGVCQDYTHIFIALCHFAGIAARYVTGIITGEGESHAWAEILYRGRWIGMDPTNDVLVARKHIKFANGRDASDCLINRGILFGNTAQTQKINVTVTEE